MNKDELAIKMVRSAIINDDVLGIKMVKSTIITKNDALKFIDALVEVIGEELKKEKGKVTLVGFGIFKTVLKKKKKGINPITGAEIFIPKKKVKFFPASKLKASVYGHSDLKIQIGRVRGDVQVASNIITINSMSDVNITVNGGILSNKVSTHGTGNGPDED